MVNVPAILGCALPTCPEYTSPAWMVVAALALSVAALGGYLFGSIPFGFLLGKLIWKVDIRTAGSKNIGATNLARVVGKPWGPVAFALVFILDFAKGAIPVIPWTDVITWKMLPITAGLAAIAGHTWPIWLKFKGGKGVATSAGVFMVLAPKATLIAVAVFLVCFGLTRIVSASSIAAAVALPITAAWSGRPVSIVGLTVVVAVLVIVKHRSNLGRLVRGEEKKIVGEKNGA